MIVQVDGMKSCIVSYASKGRCATRISALIISNCMVGLERAITFVDMRCCGQPIARDEAEVLNDSNLATGDECGLWVLGRWYVDVSVYLWLMKEVREWTLAMEFYP